MNDKARSTSSGINREVGATPLINSKNHRPASDQIAPLRERPLVWFNDCDGNTFSAFHMDDPRHPRHK